MQTGPRIAPQEGAAGLGMLARHRSLSLHTGESVGVCLATSLLVLHTKSSGRPENACTMNWPDF